MPITKTSKRGAELQQRRERAVALRKTGASFRAIAAKIAADFGQEKYNESVAYKDVRIALEESRERMHLDSAELIQLELQRYDDYLLRLQPDIQKGDIRAIESALKISKQRRELLGLDAPIQIQVEEKVAEAVNVELNAFLEALQPALAPDVFKQVLTAVATLSDRAAVASEN